MCIYFHVMYIYIYIYIRIMDIINPLLKFHSFYTILKRKGEKRGQLSVYIAKSIVT